MRAHKNSLQSNKNRTKGIYVEEGELAAKNEFEAAKMWPGGKGIGAKKSENEKIKQSKWPIRIFKRGAAEREMVARE